MGAMDYRIIGRTLEKRGLSKSGLAGALRVPNSAISELLKGNRRLLADEVPKVKKYLKLDTVPLKGFVAAGSAATFFELPDDELERVPAPDYANENTVAVEIRGESLGSMFDHWLAFYDHVERPFTANLINQLCIVGLDDGRVLIKKIKRNKAKAIYLISNNEEPMFDVKIEWAAKVLDLRPR